MNTEDRKRIEDFFEGFELVEFLQISVSDVIDAFEELVEESLDDIEELIGVSSKSRTCALGERKQREEEE